jgi:phenylalanyl-tRNA synthetase beta chain
MERATALLIAVAGGRAGPLTECTGNLPKPIEIQLDYKNINRVLGLSIPEEEITDILVRLGLILQEKSDTGLRVAVPSFRFDLSIEADLIEELARIYGYNRLPKTRSTARLALQSQPEAVTPLIRVKERMVSLGYQEVITYSFVEPGLLNRIKPVPAPVSVQNPISSDMSVMRTTLWAGLLNTYRHNTNRQQNRIRIFETGQIFLRQGIQISQPAVVAGLISGSRSPELWCNAKDMVDFFDLKGDIESLLSLGANTRNLQFVAATDLALHDGQCAKVLINGEEAGIFGALHPALQRQLDINTSVYLFELQLEKVQQAIFPAACELSRYPEVNRDLALIVDNAISGAQIVQVIQDNAGDLLKNLRIFDVYQGDAIEKSKKSIALGLTLQHPSRTLGDDDINAIINNCVKELEDTFNAKLRN